MFLLGRTQPLAPLPIVECLQQISESGFDGAEICLENPDISPTSISEGKISSLVETLSEWNMVSNSLSYHGDYIYDDKRLADTVKAIGLTRQLGTEIFVFSGSVAREGDTAPWERMLARTRKLVSTAEDAGVTLAIEFEPNFIVGSTEDLHRLFTAMPSPNLKANLDLGHVFLCDPDPFAAI